METIEEKQQRFAACSPEMLAWAEEAGYGNLKGRIETGDRLSAYASTMLTLLYAGIGGSLVYAVRVVEPHAGVLAWGAAALCGYLTLLAVVLMWRCILLASAPMLYNSPGNLLQPSFELRALRAAELVNLQDRIERQAARNAARGAWLDRVRLAALCSPAVVAFGAAVSRYA